MKEEKNLMEARNRPLIRNVLLTLLAAFLLFGFALAIPDGDVSDELEDAWEEEDETSDDLYDFL